MRTIKGTMLAMLLLVLLVGQAGATSILVSVSSGNLGYGYGFSSWDNFSAALDTASGGGVVTAPDFTNLASMLSFDALMLDQRWVTGSLTAIETDNIAAFIATGRRVLLMGENDAWTPWNNQILGIVGGSYLSHIDTLTSSVLVHELTAGASTLDLPMGGVANGGTALYSHNFATLWGANQNVLTVLDVNLWSDSEWDSEDNGQFGTNVANWLAATPNNAPVPEPATMTLMGLGLAGLVLRARKKSAVV